MYVVPEYIREHLIPKHMSYTSHSPIRDFLFNHIHSNGEIHPRTKSNFPIRPKIGQRSPEVVIRDFFFEY